MKKSIIIFLLLIALSILCNCSSEKDDNPLNLYTSKSIVSGRTVECLKCHTKKQPSIVSSWRKGSHSEVGVGCYECHQADLGDADSYEHYGSIISTIVTPNDCSKCHQAETEQFLASHHAKAGEILHSLDNYLGEIVEGNAATVSGCLQCHGSKIEILENKKLSPKTFPNFGIGRINPDGTSGTCSACHSRHDFSLKQVRSPETCAKCHMGPDHPQKEVYEESKHNIAYTSHKDEMNMDSKRWVVGVDYTAAPTCATCHTSATQNQSKSHDIGNRISWTLRPEISVKVDNANRKRSAMKEVCTTCHSVNYVDNFYEQYDDVVHLYNDKFAKPAKLIMDRLKEAEKIDPTPFNEKIEWLYFFLWHHEGRRARHGAAMMGPDYVQWHGFYEVAHRFYIELVPEAEKLLHGVTADIVQSPEHKWFTGTMTEEERQQISEFYKSKYGQND